MALGSKYKARMGTLLHGAQLVNQPFPVDLANGPHSQTKLVGHHGILHQTILNVNISTKALECVSATRIRKLPTLSNSFVDPCLHHYMMVIECVVMHIW